MNTGGLFQKISSDIIGGEELTGLDSCVGEEKQIDIFGLRAILY